MQKLVIRSGAQTGVDQAGLDVALKLGLETRSWMPQGFLTQDGKKPEYAAKYGALEFGEGYKDRTWKNIEDSHVTMRIAADFTSAGERCTYNGIQHHKKPHFDIDIVKYTKASDALKDYTVLSVVAWLYWKRPDWSTEQNSEYVINIAGNTEKTSPGIYSKAYVLLDFVFRSYQRMNHPCLLPSFPFMGG